MPTKISKAKYYDKFFITGKTPSRYDRVKIRAWNKKYYDKLRNEVLFHYSNGTMKCNCCGELQLEFLALDHINGGGKQHRKQVKSFYSMLRRENYPVGYQILCHNCNMAKGFYGICPHQKERIIA